MLSEILCLLFLQWLGIICSQVSGAKANISESATSEKVPTRTPMELNSLAEAGGATSWNTQILVFCKHKCLFKVAYTYFSN